MLFNSLEFALFFPTVVVAYFLAPFRWRWLLLLLASYYFYARWKPAYLGLIVASTLVDYVVAIALSAQPAGWRRRGFLLLSLGANLGLLFAFKYYGFFRESLSFATAALGFDLQLPTLHVLLPVGISFYTFQTLSYTIDVYRGKREPERHMGVFALYVAFFPQLVAGPIERSTHLLPQFRRHHDFSYARVTNGLKLMAWGLFKKVVVADRLASLVDKVYSNPAGFDGPYLIVASYLFAFQIFCDFSGYSDIAIGAAQVMGFDLMENFRRPYFAGSVAEFWRRWHISLSTWFRDYVYVALGGNRVSRWRWNYNIFVVFLVSGLWHGAQWKYVLWGALHGTFLVLESATSDLRQRLWNAVGLQQRERVRHLISVFVTFHMVIAGWVFFRANDVGDAIYILSHLGSGFTTGIEQLLGIVPFDVSNERNFGVWRTDIVLCFLLIGIVETGHLIQETQGIAVRDWLSKRPVLVRWAAYYACLFAIIFGGVQEKTQFIYFQF